MVTKTKVTELGIYRHSATVTRTSEVSLAEGRNIIYVAGITNTADIGSFRLKCPDGVSAANIKIIKAEDAEGYEKESESINGKIAEIDYRIETSNIMKLGEDVLAALSLLTHKDDEPYMDYIAAVAHNPIARSAKIADLRHNMDTSRLNVIDNKAEQRLAKYRKALELLETSRNDEMEWEE